LTKVEKTILLLLEKDPELSKPKISKMIELSESSVKRIFNDLQKKGIIKHYYESINSDTNAGKNKLF